MYAIIESGSKQFVVRQGDVINVPKMDLEEGAAIEFDKVLLISDGESPKLGESLKSTVVKAKVVAHGRDKKISVLKFKRRKHHMKSQGHRQWHTQVEILEISA